MTAPIQIDSESTHDNPLTYDLSSFNYPYSAATHGSATVTFVSATSPSVLARVRSASGLSVVGGQMDYEFYFSGPASSFVPISFSGLFSLSNEVGLSGITYAYFQIYTPSPTHGVGGGSAGMQFYCTDVCDFNMQPVSSSGSSIRVNYTALNAATMADRSNASGTFAGVVMGATDADGKGRGHVTLSAHVQGGGTDKLFSAFIDPYLSIEASYLAANPGASLTLPPGVGNEVSAVPEPATALLAVSGLSALSLRARRRHHHVASTHGVASNLCP